MRIGNQRKNGFASAWRALGLVLLGTLDAGAPSAVAGQAFPTESRYLEVPNFTFHDGKMVSGLKLHF